MAQYHDFDPNDAEFSPVSESDPQHCFIFLEHTGAHAQAAIGELSSHYDQDNFISVDPWRAARSGDVGHGYATVDEHVFAIWGEAHLNYEPTGFQLAQELQADSPEGPGLVSDDTISSAISTRSSLHDTQPIGGATPESASPAGFPYAADSVVNDALLFDGPMVPPASQSSILPDLTQSRLQPGRRCNERNMVRPSDTAYSIGRSTETVAIPRLSRTVPEPRVRYYCKKINPCPFSRKGFSRDDSRIRHEKSKHATIECPSNNVLCPGCDKRRRKDKHEQHWGKCQTKDSKRTG